MKIDKMIKKLTLFVFLKMNTNENNIKNLKYNQLLIHH